MIDARVKVGDLDKENATLLVERNVEKTAQGYHWRSDPRLRLPSALYLTPGQSSAFSNNLDMPVLLIYGEDGFIKKYPALKKVVSGLKHEIKTTKLAGGHHLHMQHPNATREAICAFYQQLTS